MGVVMTTISTTAALQIIAQVDEIEIINDVPSSAARPLALVGDSDFDITHEFTYLTNDGSLVGYFFTPRPPTSEFEVRVQGVVAEDGSLTKIRQNLVRDYSQFPTFNGTDLSQITKQNNGVSLQEEEEVSLAGIDSTSLLATECGSDTEGNKFYCDGGTTSSLLDGGNCDTLYRLQNTVSKDYNLPPNSFTWGVIDPEQLNGLPLKVTSSGANQIIPLDSNVQSNVKCTSLQSKPATGVAITVSLFSNWDTCGGGFEIDDCNPAPWIGRNVVDSASCIGSTNEYTMADEYHGGTMRYSAKDEDEATGGDPKSANARHKCTNGATADNLQALVWAQGNLSRALSDAVSNYTKLDTIVSDVLTNLTRSSNATRVFNDAILQQAKTVNDLSQRELQAQFAMSDLFAANLRDRVVGIRNASDLQQANTVLLEQNARITLDNFQNFTAALSRASMDMTESFESVASQLVRSQFVYRYQFRLMERLILLEASILNRFQADQDMKDGLTRQTQTVLQLSKSVPGQSGFPLFPFLNDVGSPGIDNPNLPNPLLYYITVSDMTFKYIGSDNFGYSTRIQTRCQSTWFITESINAPSTRQTLSYLGPESCDETGSKPGNITCRCFIQVVERRCAMPVNPDLYLFTGNPSTLSVPTGCLSTPADGLLDGTIVRGTWNLQFLFSAISLRGIRSGTNYTYTPNILQIGSFALPYESMVSNVTNFQSLLQDSSNTPFSIVYAFGQTIRSEVTSSVTDLVPAIRIQIIGALPDNLTQKYAGYGRIAGKTAGRSVEVSYMSYTNNMVQVASLHSGLTESIYNVTVGGQTTIASYTFTNPFDYLLRKIRTLVFGSTTFDQFIYNAPNEAVVFTGYEGVLRNRITYSAVPNKDLFDIDTWMAMKGGVPFRHPSGGNLPYPYKEPLVTDPSAVNYHRCARTPVVAGGHWCSTLEHYNIRLAGSSLFLTSRDATAAIQLPVPPDAKSPLRQILATSCPVVTQIANSYNSLLIQLYNPSVTGTVQIGIVQVGACPSTRTISIGLGGTSTVAAFSCPAAPSATPDYLQFSYFSGTRFITCPGIVTLSYKDNTASSFRGAASFNLSRTLVQYRQDSLIGDLNSFRAEALGLLDSITTNFAQQFTFGFQIPNITLTDYSQLISDAIANANQAYEDATAAGNQVVDITPILEALAAQLAKINAEAAARRLVIDAAYQSAYNDNQNGRSGISRIAELAAVANVEWLKVAQVFRPFGEALALQIKARIRTNPDSAWAKIAANETDGQGEDGAWTRVGQLFVNLPGNAVDALKDIYSTDLGSAFTSLLPTGGGTAATIGVIVLVAAIGIATIVAVIMIIRRYATKHLYPADADAIAAMLAQYPSLAEEIRSRSDETSNLLRVEPSSSSSTNNDSGSSSNNDAKPKKRTTVIEEF